jgi:phosphodiesterase/alkaline phosphatase D-like protein
MRAFVLIFLIGGLAMATSVQLPLQPGWNLVSAPVDVSAQPVSSLFGSTISGTVWGWGDGHLIEVDRLQPGQACWVYRDPALGAAAVNVSGDLVEQLYRPLATGWNLVGPLGYPPVAQLHWPLRSQPPNAVIAGPWLHGEAGWARPNGLASGEGAWIYTARDARVRLSGHPIMSPFLANSPGLGTLALHWGPASDDLGVAHYDIYAATSPSNLIAPGNRLGESNGASFSKNNLTPGATYHASVLAEDSEGNSSGFARSLPVKLQSVAPNVVATPRDLASMNLQVTNLAADASSLTISGPDAGQIQTGTLIIVDSQLRMVTARSGGNLSTRAAVLGEALRDGQVVGALAISADDLGPHILAPGIGFDGELRFQPTLHFDATFANGALSNWTARLEGDMAITGVLSVNLAGGRGMALEQVLHGQTQSFTLMVGSVPIPLQATLEWVAEVTVSADSAGWVDAEFAMTAPLDATIRYANGFGVETAGSNSASMPQPTWTLRRGGNLDISVALSPRLRLAMFADEVADFAFHPTLALDSVFEKRARRIGFTELELLLNSDYTLRSDIGVMRNGTAPWSVPLAVASTRLLGSPVLTLPSATFVSAPNTLYLTEPQVFEITTTNGIGNVVQPSGISWRVEGDGPAPSIALSNDNRRAAITVPDLGSYTLVVTVNGSALPGAMGAHILRTPFIATHIPYRFLGATRIDGTTVDVQFSEPADPENIGDFDLNGTPVIHKDLLDDGSRVRLHTHYLYNYADSVTITGALNMGGRGLVEPTTRSISPASLAPLFRTTFDSGMPSGWQVVDDPLATSDAPSGWLVQDGTLRHTTLIRGGNPERREDPHKPGTYFLHSAKLANSLVEASLRSFSSWGMGLILRYQASDRYYRFEWSGGDENPNSPEIDGVRRIVKVTPEGSIELASDRTAFFRGYENDVRFLAIGERLSVFVDDELVMQAADGEYAEGQVGVYAWGNNGLQVDNLTVAVPDHLLSYTDLWLEQRPTAPSMHHGTLMSEINSRGAIAWARSSEAADVRLRYGTAPDLAGASVTPSVRTEALRDFGAHIRIDNLTPGTTYYARTEVVDIARPDQVNYTPVREFRTPPESGPMDMSLVLFGDVAVGDTPAYRAFDALSAENADYLISLGDFPYADHVPAAKTTLEFMHKHAHARGLPRMRQLLNQTPIWGTWDDHEVTNDWDGEKSRQLMGNALEAWHSWWPLRREPEYIRPASNRLDTTQAFRFDIQDSALRTSQGFDFGQKVSVAFWFKWRVQASEDPFFRGVGPSTTWLGLFQDSTAKFRCKVYTTATDYTFFSAGGWADDSWHHALFQVDTEAQLATLYLDGMEAVRKKVEGQLRQPTSFIEFGGSNGGPDALIDEIVIYDHVDLDPWEFHNEDNTPRPPPPGMKLWWRAEALNFPTVLDQSGNGNNALASGVEAETFIETSTHVVGRSPRAVPNYRKVRFGDTTEVFFLDTRFYRDANAPADDGSKTMLGSTQLAWLLDGLSASTSRFKLIVSTVAMRYGTTPNDYWAGFTRERDIIFNHIVANNIKVLFLSGDQHWHAVYSHPEGFLEVQTSSITAGTRPPAVVPEANRRFIAEVRGYTRLDIFGSDDPRIEIRLKDTLGRVGFTETVR